MIQIDKLNQTLNHAIDFAKKGDVKYAESSLKRYKRDYRQIFGSEVPEDAIGYIESIIQKNHPTKKNIFDIIRKSYPSSNILEVHGMFIDDKFISYAIMTDEVIDPVIELKVSLGEEDIERLSTEFWQDIEPILPDGKHRLIMWGTNYGARNLSDKLKKEIAYGFADKAKMDAKEIVELVNKLN